ncbi:uncharacterized protein TNCV_1308941 [Trichonephila clavipes]|nr:uncharacterized protein TNCV_1308941 [Trichonephila clavipes]
MVAQRETDAETTEDDEEGGQPLPPLPCIRRALKGEGIISSDYESSNESPVSSENNDLLSVDDHLPKSLAVQTIAQDLSRCTLCGGKTKHGVSIEGPSRSPNLEDVTPTVQDTNEVDRWRHHRSPPPQIMLGIEGREIFSSPLHSGFSPQYFGPTDLTGTYSVCTRRVYGDTGIKPRPSGLESYALTTVLIYLYV